jgi:subtilisin-like proprotein convertase family protein
MRHRIWCSLSVCTLAFLAACQDILPTGPQLGRSNGHPASAVAFCNTASLALGQNETASGPAVPYPSSVSVSGITSEVGKVTVSLSGLSHTFPADLDFLLVGPTGAYSLLMSDVGGGFRLTSVNLTFDDLAATGLNGTQIVSGTFRPSNVNPGQTATNPGAADLFPAPAPAGSPTGYYTTPLSVFNGTNANGTWSLYALDDGGGDQGFLAGGWCLNLTQANNPPVANAGGAYSGTEGAAITFSGAASSDPDQDVLSYAWDFGDGSTGAGVTSAHVYPNEGSFVVTLVVTDPHGLSSSASTEVVVANAAPVVGPITGLPAEPIAVGTAVTISASFTDAGTADTHTSTVQWRVGGSLVPATVSEENGSGVVTATAILPAGVHSVTLTVTDNSGASTVVSSGTQSVVVYDPDGTSVHGSGWISSPAGAYVGNAEVQGEAHFALIARYKADNTTPSGSLWFLLKNLELRFESSSYEWLVVTRSEAQARGVGTLNGESGYTFALTVVDGAATGSPDRFRLVISGPNGVIYDNGGTDGKGSVLSEGSIKIKIMKATEDQLSDRPTGSNGKGKGRNDRVAIENGRRP